MTAPRTFRVPAGLPLLYLALPLVIFFIGWLTPVWAVLAVAPLLICGCLVMRPGQADSFTISMGELLFLAVFSFGMAAFAGIGAYAPQEFDWIYHNPVLADCIRQPWPVMLAEGPVRWPLVYYLAYYMPAILLGKLGGYALAQAALWVWSSLGLMLSLLWFARLSRLSVGMAALGFFSFSGLVFLASLLVQLLGLSGYKGWTGLYPYEFWARIWQFPSHFWMLEWSPGQALAGWISAGLYLHAPRAWRPAWLVFLFVCDLFWSPFIGVGLVLMAFFLFWQEGWERPVRFPLWMCSLILPAAVLAAFYLSKISPEVIARFPRIPLAWFSRFQDAPGIFQSLELLCLFVIFQFGILAGFVWALFPKGSAERALTVACGFSLTCLLPVTMGYYNDLAMRACTVPWFGLALLTGRALVAGGSSPRVRRWFLLVVLVSALTPLIEMGDQGRKIVTQRYNSDTVPRSENAVVQIPGNGFDFLGAQYVGSTNSFFWRSLAR